MDTSACRTCKVAPFAVKGRCWHCSSSPLHHLQALVDLTAQLLRRWVLCDEDGLDGAAELLDCPVGGPVLPAAVAEDRARGTVMAGSAAPWSWARRRSAVGSSACSSVTSQACRFRVAPHLARRRGREATPGRSLRSPPSARGHGTAGRAADRRGARRQRARPIGALVRGSGQPARRGAVAARAKQAAEMRRLADRAQRYAPDAAPAAGAKKKRMWATLKNGGKGRRAGDPVKVSDHDLPDKELGTAIPYGCTTWTANTGPWVTCPGSHVQPDPLVGDFLERGGSGVEKVMREFGQGTRHRDFLADFRDVRVGGVMARLSMT